MDDIKNNHKEFEPSFRTLTRIFDTFEEYGPSVKTHLSLKTNLNYTRLAKHLVWMESKGFVESINNKSEITIEMTENGRQFAELISNK